MYSSLLVTLGSFFVIATMLFAMLFRVLARRTGSDFANGCLALIICCIGTTLSLSCYYFAVV